MSERTDPRGTFAASCRAAPRKAGLLKANPRRTSEEIA